MVIADFAIDVGVQAGRRVAPGFEGSGARRLELGVGVRSAGKKVGFEVYDRDGCLPLVSPD